jgi:hypothetical protein
MNILYPHDAGSLPHAPTLLEYPHVRQSQGVLFDKEQTMKKVGLSFVAVYFGLISSMVLPVEAADSSRGFALL